ncbi:MAG: PIN domain-containing protein, partial [Ottowia sp.]|nr:PIN domain-containing protein [Ottowia sp.]
MQSDTVVIDTNWVLDAWVFADARATALQLAVEAGRVRWLATAAMRDELARVLDYPAVALRLARRGMSAAEALALFDALAQVLPAAPRAPVVCRDADDQPFIDLA